MVIGRALLLLPLLAGAVACSKEKSSQKESYPSAYQKPESAAIARSGMSLTLSSSAFTNSGKIPRRYTCEGNDISPPLAWNGVPQGTKSLALIVDDPDAPDPAKPQRVYVHWVLYNIPPTDATLSEGASSGSVPSGAVNGSNDFGKIGYGGPCPPIGRHRYFFKLYALDSMLNLSSAKKKDLEAAMKGHILDETQLMGTYQKGD